MESIFKTCGGNMVEKIFDRIFKRQDITGTHDGHIYLKRWTVINILGRRLYIHKMERPDQDRCPHNHPNKFYTFIVYGGYKEELLDGTIVHNKPFTFHIRKAKYSHRISELPKGFCWTIVFMCKRTQKWGFFTREGFKPSAEFLSNPNKSAEWCDK